MTRDENLIIPPHSLEAEASVLGGLMLDERALAKVADWLTEGDFYRKDHRLIFRAITELAGRNMPVDAVTMGEWFEANALSELVGGVSYVIDLANSTPSAANITAYAEIVKEKSRLRTLLDLGNEIFAKATKTNGRSAGEISAHALGVLGGIVSESRLIGPVSVKTASAQFYEDISASLHRETDLTGLATPWIDVNAKTLGLQPDELFVIAGRPGMGKSAAGDQIGMHNALLGKRVHLFSLEMSAKQNMRRLVSAFGGVRHDSLRDPKKLTEEEWTVISDTLARFKKAPLLIDEQPNLTGKQIIARAKREHLKHPVDLIIVDHLIRVSIAGDNPRMEYGQVVTDLKNLAKELHVPVVLLTQLNRANLSRAERRPNMGDLRETGRIEEEADVIVFLHREDYYDKNTHLKHVAEVIYAKGRDFESGTDYLEEDFAHMRFNNWPGPLPTPPMKESKRKGGGLFGLRVPQDD